MPPQFRERFWNRVRRPFAESGAGRRLCLAMACVAACFGRAADYCVAPCSDPGGPGTAEALWVPWEESISCLSGSRIARQKPCDEMSEG